MWLCCWGLCLSFLRSGKTQIYRDVYKWKGEGAGKDSHCLSVKMHPEQLRKSHVPNCYFTSEDLQSNLLGLGLCITWMTFAKQVKRIASIIGPSRCDFLCLVFGQFISKINTTVILYLQTGTTSTVSWMSSITLLHAAEVCVLYTYNLNTTYIKKHFPTKQNEWITKSIKWSISRSCT